MGVIDSGSCRHRRTKITKTPTNTTAFEAIEDEGFHGTGHSIVSHGITRAGCIGPVEIGAVWADVADRKARRENQRGETY